MSDNAPKQMAIQSDLEFSLEKDLAIFTPRKMNGVGIVSPVPVIITIDQLIDFTARVIVARNDHLARKEAATAGVGLILPGARK